jgi:hypothetical protein
MGFAVFFPLFGQGRCGMFESYEAREKELEHIRAGLDNDWNRFFMKYTTHECEDLRRDVYGFIWEYAKKSQEEKKRKLFVEILISGLKDKAPLVSNPIPEWLCDFSSNDFSENSRAALIVLPYARNGRIIRVIGIAEVNSVRETIEHISQNNSVFLSSTQWHQSPEWAALLVLARWGDKNAMVQVLDKIRKVSDYIVLGTKLFPDLAYTRQNEAFDALRTYVNSQERLPALKETVPGTPLAYYAASASASQLRNFPIAADNIDVSDLPQIRTWMNSQKIWQVK